MVKNFGTQFCFLTTGAVKETVINDKNIFSCVISQTLDIVVNDICRKKRCKTEPVSFGRIQESIKSIFGGIRYDEGRILE